MVSSCRWPHIGQVIVDCSSTVLSDALAIQGFPAHTQQKLLD